MCAVPPAASTVSRTAREARTSYRIAAPGSLRRIDSASSAVRKSPSTKRPVSSMKKQRSASPSQAMPSSAPVSPSLSMMKRRFSSSSGFGSWSGELAVRLPVGAHLLEREAVEQRPDHRAGHAVATVEHHLPGRDPARVDEGERVLAEGVAHVLGRDLPRPLRGRAGLAGGHDLAQLADARVAGERERAALHELRARVGRRVVRGGAHEPAVELARADRPVQLLGPDHPDVDHVAPSSAMPRAYSAAMLGAESRMSRPSPTVSSSTGVSWRSDSTRAKARPMR